MLTNTGTAKLHSLIYSKIIPIFSLLLLLSIAQAVHAKDLVCGSEVRAEVAKRLSAVIDIPATERLAMEAELYKEYDYCAQDTHLSLDPEPPILSNKQDALIAVPYPKPNIHTAARRCGAKAKVFYRSSIYFEEMSCCGYDPQRRQFACPVKIKQRSGYGGAPLPGSREYVKHCVADRTGRFVPVGVDSVHLANEMHGASPTWQFAVIANANENLQTIYPMNGETRRARSILSWGFQPTSCNFRPYWGNVLEYRIRLDQ